jgi:DNA polymerase-3 subunit delta'
LVHSDLHFVFPNTAVKSTDKDVSSKDLMQEFRTYVLENNSYIRLEDFFEYLGVEKKQGAINVRDAAEINRILGLKTYEAKYKVMVIWMIEKLNTAAASKLLKILEEPTDNTVFLLVSENQDKILSTIRSRMQNVQLRKIDEQSMRQYLQNILPDSNVENILQAAEGDIIEARNIISKTEQDQLFAELFVTWTRQLFKLQMLSLSAWVDKMHTMGREQQKQFLLYALDSFRACFLKTVAGVNLSYQLDFGDEKFNNAFPRMISERNIEGIENVINKTIYAIERNAFSKIAFMDLSFSISKLLKQ